MIPNHPQRFHKHHRHLGVLRMSARPHLEVNQELGSSMDQLIGMCVNGPLDRLFVNEKKADS